MKKVLSALLASLFCGCSVNSDKKVTLDNFEFKTGDDTELFFKNIRQSYYELEENTNAKFNLFRLKDRVVSDTLPILNLPLLSTTYKTKLIYFLNQMQSLMSFNPWYCIGRIPLMVRKDSLNKKV